MALKQKIVSTTEIYKDSITRIKEAFPFVYSVMDVLFTFVGKKSNKNYVWTAMAYTKRGKPFYFHRLSERRTSSELFEFDLDLPKVEYFFCDEAFSYDKIYGNAAIQEKGAMTNRIENLNSQLRDKIAYLVRRSKAHAKSEAWLNFKLARFFINKNLGG